ncbi:MAG: hypothetical protein EXS64_09820 [Candidatus Latescibacteria bacterium]|nr:hypothetical protein [Candidatus Latescibacterota bacterium]
MKPLLIIALLLPAALFADLPETPVAKADKKTIQLKAGTNRGLKAGMWLDVFRQEEPIVHPITGEVLGSPRVKIAEVQVTKVLRTSAVGKITLSYAPILAGDLVREAGSVPMQPAERPASTAPAEKRHPAPAPSEETQRTAERLTREISDIRANIAALSRTLARIAGIERTVSRMKGDLGAMQSTVASLKHEVESLREKPPAVVNVSRENFEEFKVKHTNLNVAVRSGPEPLLIPMEAFAQIILPYVKEEQQAAIDSLVKLKVEEMKGVGKVPAEVKGGEPHPAPRPEEDPMAELQKLLDEGKSKPVWKVYLETYWPAAAGVGVFLGLVIVVMKLLRRKKPPSDDEEGILSIDEEMPAPMPETEEEEEEQR